MSLSKICIKSKNAESVALIYSYLLNLFAYLKGGILREFNAFRKQVKVFGIVEEEPQRKGGFEFM